MEPNAMRLLLHWKTMWSICSLNICKEVRTKHDILNSPKKACLEEQLSGLKLYISLVMFKLQLKPFRALH